MKGHITWTTVANEARMLRTVRHGPVCILEGADDKRFYRRFLDGSCSIVISYGRYNALAAVEHLEKTGFVGFVAILDSDYGSSTTSRNIAWSGVHDLECLLAITPALDKLLLDMGSPKMETFELQQAATVRERIVAASAVVGEFRLTSAKYSYGLKFESINYASFVNTETLQVDRTRLLMSLKSSSQRHDLMDAQFIAHLAESGASELELWRLICGHDLLNILALALRRTIATHNAIEVATERLASSLRLAYEDQWFCDSRVYVDLCRWEGDNAPYVVLSSETKTRCGAIRS